MCFDRLGSFFLWFSDSFRLFRKLLNGFDLLLFLLGLLFLCRCRYSLPCTDLNFLVLSLWNVEIEFRKYRKFGFHNFENLTVFGLLDKGNVLLEELLDLLRDRRVFERVRVPAEKSEHSNKTGWNIRKLWKWKFLKNNHDEISKSNSYRCSRSWAPGPLPGACRTPSARSHHAFLSFSCS